MVDEAVSSTHNVKYKRTTRSLKNSQGIEITSMEQYERLGDSSLVRAAVALTRFSASLGAKSKAAASLASENYRKVANRIKQGAKSFVSKISRWLEKWLFFVFKGTEEGLTKVTG